MLFELLLFCREARTCLGNFVPTHELFLVSCHEGWRRRSSPRSGACSASCRFLWIGMCL